MAKHILSILLLYLVISCGQPSVDNKSENNIDNRNEMTQPLNTKKDAHSFARPENAYTSHLDLDIKVDFDTKVVSGKAGYNIHQPNSTGEIIFDTKSLNIEKVTLDNEEPTSFTIEEEIDAIHGQALKIKIKPNTKKVQIYYNTTKGSEALQWLNPQQTTEKKHPFLFTQGEAILTRSWIPIQDSPGNKITYNAKVEVPKELFAVMSAVNPQEKSKTGVYNFTLDQPIPCYLIALAVGDLQFKSLGDRTGVYTEPSILTKCANELEDLEKMVSAGEALYGPYRWGRYDVIVLPSSFPFGGMENPKLTFATPTIIAGDKSLVSLIAHELAHSWSGNLVTNHTWNDFWLNEGFTVYFENRIMEAVYGKQIADMNDELNYQALDKTIEAIGNTHQDTHLKLNLNGRNPDDGMTDIAYNKGALLLTNLEKKVGREKWDKFITNYFNHFAFKTITTEEFVEYINNTLLQPNNIAFNLHEWIYSPGLPNGHFQPVASQFKVVNEALKNWAAGTPITKIKTDTWSTYEWLYFIGNLPKRTSKEQLAQLDKAFGFTNSTNSEIAALWFEKSIEANYLVVANNLESFLINVGRRKYLVPLYKVLIDNGHLALAEKIYTKARPNYHSVSFNTIDDIFSREKAKISANA